MWVITGGKIDISIKNEVVNEKGTDLGGKREGWIGSGRMVFKGLKVSEKLCRVKIFERQSFAARTNWFYCKLCVHRNNFGSFDEIKYKILYRVFQMKVVGREIRLSQFDAFFTAYLEFI